MDPGYEFMGAALNRTGRPVMYSCSWPDYMRETGYVNYTLTAQHCNIWRMYADIQDSWDSVTGIVDWVGDFAGNATSPGLGMVAAAGPGGFNDPCVSEAHLLPCACCRSA